MYTVRKSESKVTSVNEYYVQGRHKESSQKKAIIVELQVQCTTKQTAIPHIVADIQIKDPY